MAAQSTKLQDYSFIVRNMLKIEYVWYCLVKCRDMRQLIRKALNLTNYNDFVEVLASLMIQ